LTSPPGALDLGQARHGLLQRGLQGRHVGPGALQQRAVPPSSWASSAAAAGGGFDELLVVADGDALGIGEGLLELGGEFVEAHDGSGVFKPRQSAHHLQAGFIHLDGRE
jgi:hypothetical protein